MSSTGERRSILEAARKVFAHGGLRAFYRGLGVSTNYYSVIHGVTTDSISRTDRISGSIPVSTFTFLVIRDSEPI